MNDLKLEANGTARLVIRLMERADIEDARLLHNDDATLARLTDVLHVSQAQQDTWFQSVSTSRSSRRYVARLREDGTFVGVFRVDRIDMQNRNCLVGCDIVPLQRRRGYAEEFFGYMLDYLFLQLGMRRVGLVTITDNQPAISLYQKLGFVTEGVERDAIFRDGRFQDLVPMGLLVSEWSGKKPGRS